MKNENSIPATEKSQQQKEELILEFNRRKPVYEQLKSEAPYILDKKLKQSGIRIHTISNRIIELESFLDKVERKQYEKPFEQIQDFLGLRVICLFLSDIQRIEEVIRNCFVVIEADNKIEGFDVTPFGDTSVHFIVRLGDAYKGTRYEDIINVPFEIQIRTIAMDAWANVRRSLEYKSEQDIPNELKRDFYALNFVINSIQDQERFATKEFDFPVEVRSFCEQYLLYFVDFLRDAGVSATANLDHDSAGKVLFSVKPDNPEIALDKIRKALDIYLELPLSPIAAETQDADSRALMLSSEINTLKSRLDMAQFKALEQEKRLNLQAKLIQSQEESFDRERSILQQYLKEKFNPSILQNAFVDAEIIEETTTDAPQKQDLKEGDINLGLVKVEPAKIGGGVKVDTPKLVRLGVRNLKELFEKMDKYLNEK